MNAPKENHILNNSNQPPKNDDQKISKVEDSGKTKVEGIIDNINSISNDTNRIHSAWNRYTYHQELEELSQDKNYIVRANVASNPNTTREILEKLALDENKYVRANVAERWEIPYETRLKLAKDKEPIVRCGIILNTRTSEEELLSFLYDEETIVQLTLAKIPKVPHDIANKIIKEGASIVKVAFIKNPSTRTWHLGKLLSDNDLDIRMAFATRPYCRDYHVSEDLDVHQTVAKDETITFYKEWIAKQEDTPKQVLNVLAENSHGNIQENVIENPAVSKDLLLKLTDNRNAPNIIISAIYKAHFSSDILLKILESRKDFYDYSVCMGIASFSGTPKDVLRTLYYSNQSWYVKKGLARNENTPLKILKELSLDKRPDVSQIAAKTLSRLED